MSSEIISGESMSNLLKVINSILQVTTLINIIIKIQ